MNAPLKQVGELVRRQWAQGGVRNLVGGGLTGIAVTLANRVIMLGSAVILARLLGPDDYGIYAFAIASMAVLTVFTEFGMYPILIREVSVAHSGGHSSTVVGLRNSAFRFSLSASAIAVVIGGSFIWMSGIFEDVSERIALTIMLSILPTATLIRMNAAILHGLRRLSWAQVVELFLLPSMFLVVLFLMTVSDRHIDVGVALLAYLCVSLVTLALVSVLTWKSFAQLGVGLHGEERVEGLQRRALPFVMIGAAGVLTGQLDTVLVGSFLQNEDTALYRVAAQGAALVWFGLQILQSISSPYFAKLHGAGDVKNLRRLFLITEILAALTALPILLAFIVFGEDLISLAFGARYASAYPLLVVISVGYTINVCCGPVGSLLSMTGKEKVVSTTMIATSVMSVLISFVLIQRFGAMGVAISTSCSIASYHLVLRSYCWTKYRI